MRSLGVPVKLNAVLLAETAGTVTELARFAEEGVPVRFIELMPMGVGRFERGYDPDAALAELRRVWPDLHPVDAHIGFGPAQLLRLGGAQSADRHHRRGVTPLLLGCNRVRLTSRGFLKPCLCFDEGRGFARAAPLGRARRRNPRRNRGMRLQQAEAALLRHAAGYDREQAYVSNWRLNIWEPYWLYA